MIDLGSPPRGPWRRDRQRGEPPTTWVEVRGDEATGNLIVTQDQPRPRAGHRWVPITATNTQLLGEAFRQ